MNIFKYEVRLGGSDAQLPDVFRILILFCIKIKFCSV